MGLYSVLSVRVMGAVGGRRTDQEECCRHHSPVSRISQPRAVTPVCGVLLSYPAASTCGLTRPITDWSPLSPPAPPYHYS